MHCQIIEEHFRRHSTNGIRAGGIRGWAFDHAVTQLLRAGQVEVTPRAGFSLITQLLKRICFQITCSPVIRIGKHDFAYHLCHPAVVATVIVGFAFCKMASAPPM